MRFFLLASKFCALIQAPPRMIDLFNTLLKKKNRLFPRSHAERTDIKCGAFGGKPNVKRIRK
jgi:hypothetical protein